MAPVVTHTHKGISWHNIPEISDEAVQYLRDNFNFHELDLEDVRSENQRSKIDDYKDYIFIVLHLPIYNAKREKIETTELNIFIGTDYIVTVHDNVLVPLIKIDRDCKNKKTEREFYLGKGTGYFLYELVDNLYSSCFPILDAIGRSINSVEKDLFESAEGGGSSSEVKDMLRDIMNLERNIIRFRRIMLPQRTVIVTLEHKKTKFLPEKLEVYFDDVLDQLEKIWDTLNSYKEIVETLQTVNEAMISHRINNVMKILTVFSVTMLPLNLLASMYGMNINLPFSTHAMAFQYITGTMVVILLVLLWFYKRRGWL